MADNDIDAPILTDTSNPTSNTTTETTETETANTENNTATDLNLSNFVIPKPTLANEYDSLYTLTKVQIEVEKILENWK